MNVIDLTHVIEPGMPVYPGTEPPTIETPVTVEKDGFLERRISMYSHTGTHLDAPAHILAEGKTLTDISVDRFTGPGIVVDVRQTKGPLIGVDMLRSREEAIRRAEFVLLRTGWDQYWGEPEYFEKYPVLSEDAARYLTGFSLKGIGLDAISPDPADAAGLPVHHVILGAGLLVIENLTGLDRLPASGFTFFCLPLKIKEGDGSPVRAIATLET